MFNQIEIIDSLQTANIRPSVQRTAILGYLKTHFNHPTVEDIYSALYPSIPTLSKTTVYNTLKLFTQAGLIRSLTIDKENEHFDGDTKEHAHFICARCGKIMDIKADFIKPPESLKKEISVEKIEVSFFGKCKNCINKK